MKIINIIFLFFTLVFSNYHAQAKDKATSMTEEEAKKIVDEYFKKKYPNKKNQIIDTLNKKNIPHVSVFKCTDQTGTLEFFVNLPLKFITSTYVDSNDKLKKKQSRHWEYYRSSTFKIVNTGSFKKKNDKYDMIFFSFDIKKKRVKLYNETGISKKDYELKKPKNLISPLNFGKTMDCQYRSYQMKKD